jgi:RNA polymerase sigma factor (sigma-70 family)
VLTGVLRYLNVPEQDVDDLAQEVRLTIFQKALRNPCSSDPIHRWMPSDAGATEHLHRWVRKIATHAVLNYRTKSYRRRERLSPDGVVHAVGNGRSPARHAADAERIRVLLDLLDALAESHRKVLAMHYFEQSTTEAIAQALGIPLGTVFSRLRQAREELKAAMHRTVRDGRQLLLTADDLDMCLPELRGGRNGKATDPADDGTSNRSWLALFAALLRLGSRSVATGATPAASLSGARPVLMFAPIGLAAVLLTETCSSPPNLARTMLLASPVPVESDGSREQASSPYSWRPPNRSHPQEQHLASQQESDPLDSADSPRSVVNGNTGWPPLFVGASVQASSHERTSAMKPNALIPPMIAVCANAAGCGEVALEDGGAEHEAGAALCTPGEVQSCYSGPASTEGVGICRAGIAVCNHDGTSWGSCEGESIPAPESCATPTDEDCDGMAAGCSGNLLWNKTLAGFWTETPYKIMIDSVGSMLVAGTFSNYLEFDSTNFVFTEGTPAIFLVKFDPTGSHVWSKQFVGSDLDNLSVSMAADAEGNLVLTGHFNYSLDFFPLQDYVPSAGLRDIFVAKLDPSGIPIWIRSFGDTAEQTSSPIAIDSEGNMLVAGAFDGTLDFGGNILTSAGNDIFVAKLDPQGNHLWSARFGDVNPQVDALQEATGIAVDPDGNVVLIGRFAGTSSFGGSTLASAGGTDVFVAKFDSSGNPLWSKRFGDAASQAARALALDTSANIWITGEFAGSLDFGGGTLTGAGNTDVFVAKLDSSGGHLFSDRFGDSGRQAAGSIAIDAVGHVILIGDFDGAIHFGSKTLTSIGPSDVYIAKLDAAGHPLWSKQFPGNGIGRSITSDAAGHIAAVGNFLDTIDLGSGPTASTNERDIFLLKLAP